MYKYVLWVSLDRCRSLLSVSFYKYWSLLQLSLGEYFEKNATLCIQRLSLFIDASLFIEALLFHTSLLIDTRMHKAMQKSPAAILFIEALLQL